MRHSLVLLKPRSELNYVSRNRTSIVTGKDGFMADKSHQGIFFNETRVISHYRFLMNEECFLPAASSNVDQDSWLGYYVHSPSTRPGSTQCGGYDQETQNVVELRVTRVVKDGVHEDLDITNFSGKETDFKFSVEVDADFRDREETLHRRKQTGKIRKTWTKKKGAFEISFDYHARHQYHHQDARGVARFHRRSRVRFYNCDSQPRRGRLKHRVTFEIKLKPHERWHTCVDFIFYRDGKVYKPDNRCWAFRRPEWAGDKIDDHFLHKSTEFKIVGTENLASAVATTLSRAKKDLSSLRLNDLDSPHEGWIVAAGLPMYVAVFGRDSLTAAWQSAIVDTGLIKGTLQELARRQGREDSPWRDEEPGKMIHEAHTGPLAELFFNPRKGYYGSSTTSAFYPFVVSELWHWTGDKKLISKYIGPALKALRWMDTYGILNDDGFYSYKTRSSQGLKNQSWKDSSDALVDDDGRIAEPPISTCEEQAFVYASKLHFSEVLLWMGYRSEAKKLYQEAADLKKRFNEKFWLHDKKFFSMALDKSGRTLKSIASNPGHCLACGIIDESRALQTARRLMAPELFTGWGVRTLSNRHSFYNPYSYHRGSVWPVENAAFTLGFMRYGLWDYVETLSRAVFEAAVLFDFYRLPEVFAGHQRDAAHPFPSLYPRANSPQAWSSSCTFSLIQAILGLYPYAPLNILGVDPHLPPWLPQITLKNLRVGGATVTIDFWRKASGATAFRIAEQEGTLHVIKQPSPWSLSATGSERFKDLLTSVHTI